MKEKIIGFLSLCLCLMACKSDLKLDSVPPKGPWQGGELLVVQFYESHYKEHIMVLRPRENDTYIVSDNSYLCPLNTLPNEVINTNHTSPYIDLVDNYVLVNWPNQHLIYTILWKNYGYPTDGEDALIINKWEEYEGQKKQWPLENFYVEHPVKSYSIIPVDTLVFYNSEVRHTSLHEYTSNTYNENEWKAILNQEGKSFEQQFISECNAAYEEYKEVLIQMINDGIFIEDFCCAFKR